MTSLLCDSPLINNLNESWNSILDPTSSEVLQSYNTAVTQLLFSMVLEKLPMEVDVIKDEVVAIDFELEVGREFLIIYMGESYSSIRAIK
jgi:hypothetical protein